MFPLAKLEFTMRDFFYDLLDSELNNGKKPWLNNIKMVLFLIYSSKLLSTVIFQSMKLSISSSSPFTVLIITSI